MNLPVSEVVRPASLPEAVAWLSGHPEARPITRGTDLLVQLRDGRRRAAARDVEGVEAVPTAADVPGENLVGVIFPDQPLLVADRAGMVGDRLALVAARTPEAARHAAALVRAELDPLPAVHDPVAALRPGAARVPATGNPTRTFVVRRGDTPRRRAEVVIEAECRIGGQEHAYLEPQGCLAVPEGRRRIRIIASCQCPLYVQQAVGRVLGLPSAAVAGEMAARRVETIATGWHGARSRRFDPATGTGAPAIKLAIVESEGVGGTFGAKGIGEPSLIPAAAVRNAVCDALEIELDRLPLSPPAIVAALGDSHPFARVADPEQVEAHGGPATTARDR